MLRWLLPLVLASSAGPLASEPCRPIDGLRPLLTPGRVLLLGELHGTVESPAFALDVACHAVHGGLPVVAALELSSGDQPRVDAFLASAGTEADRTALLAGVQWRRDYQDGRTSRAMLDLVDGLRRLREQGHALRVVFFDEPGNRGGQHRDRAMGRNLVEVLEASPAAMVIVLTGNNHSRITKGLRGNAEYEPMGYVLARTTPADRLVALNVAHGGGSAWICAPDCGVFNLSGRQGDEAGSIEIDEATRPAGHSGWYRVGSITASPPATMPASEWAHAMRPRNPPRSGTDEAAGDSEPTAEASGPLSETEVRMQGAWQAYDFSRGHKTWQFEFTGRRFRAQAGADDWYVGQVVVHEDRDPAWIDFAIEDCRCSYLGMTSHAIYLWDGLSLVISAPTPGQARPTRFDELGQMMRLLPRGKE